MTTQQIGFTQKQRVLQSLERAGSRGVTRADWLGSAMQTPDCGPPIINVPARINELKADGHMIVGGGKRDSCKVFVLQPMATGGQLFTLTDRRPSGIPMIYQEAA